VSLTCGDVMPVQSLGAALDRFCVHLSRLGSGPCIDVFSATDFCIQKPVWGMVGRGRRSDHDYSRE
jgi:hypothetical protein